MTETELRFQLGRRDLSEVVRRRIEANLAGDFSEGRWMTWVPFWTDRGGPTSG